MGKKLALLATSAACLAMPGVAAAQAQSDVIVMRRVIAPPNQRPTSAPTTSPTPSPTGAPAPTPTPGSTPAASPTPTVTPTPTPTPATGRWTAGDWTYATSDTCSGAALQTRTVSCTGPSGSLPDAQCAADGQKPNAERTVERLDGCTYQWRTGTYTPYDSTCSDSAHRAVLTPTVCLRSDGATANETECKGPRPEDELDKPVYDGCTIEWVQGGYGEYSTNCGMATRTQTVQCQRHGGTSAPAIQPDAACTGTRPAETSPPALVTAGCTYTKSYGAPYGACIPQGNGGGLRTTTLTSCVRSDGVDVTTANADGGYPNCAASSSEACTVTYTPTFSTTYGACVPTARNATTGTQTAPITKCVDSGGGTVANGMCGAQTTSRSCTPTYTPTYGGWSACVPASQGATTGTQTSTITACTASDGSAADVSACSGSPASTSRSCTIQSYVPAYGSCQTNSTQTIASCTTNATTGEYGFVATGLCPSSMTTRSCVRTITCDPTPVYKAPVGATSDNLQRGAQANVSAAMNACSTLFTTAAKTHAYFACQWNGQNAAGTSLVRSLYSDAPIAFTGSSTTSPDAYYRCSVQ